MAEEKEKLRLDKYLWAIRVFKTRSLATEACKAGRIKLNGTSVKPSQVVRVGDIYSVQKGAEKKIVQVTGLLEKRMDAKSVQGFYEDLTPAVDPSHLHPVLVRDRGTGRPTKKDRRDIDEVRESWGEEDE